MPRKRAASAGCANPSATSLRVLVRADTGTFGDLQIYVVGTNTKELRKALKVVTVGDDFPLNPAIDDAGIDVKSFCCFELRR